MSNYSGFEITIEKINLDDETIKKLEDIIGCMLCSYEKIVDKIEKNYLRYHKAFNYDEKKVYSTLAIIEPYIIEDDCVVEIGTIYSENEPNFLEGNIYTYKGKIYVVFKDYYCTGFGPDDYTYKIIATDEAFQSEVYSEERDLKELFDNFNALIKLKKTVGDISKTTRYSFESEADKIKRKASAQKILTDALDNMNIGEVMVVVNTKQLRSDD